jgi:hypothetical protein
VPTTKDLIDFAPAGEKALMAAPLAEAVGFFHWELEFPQVFADSTRMPHDSTRMPQIGRIDADRTTENSDPRESASSASSAFYSGSGFDVVLGNPPWERIKLQEQEHFVDVPAIAGAANKSAREKAIAAWRKGDERQRARIAQFDAARQRAEAESRFVRASGRFPLTAVGDVNTYALFAEHARNLLAPTGRAGIIVPTGIATDDTTKAFFADIVTSKRLVSFYDFENRENIFPGVGHGRFKFSLVTLGQTDRPTEYIFFATNISHLADPKRRFQLSAADIGLINPNTRTAPVFRTAQDAELTRKIYRRAPVLIDEHHKDTRDTKAEHKGSDLGALGAFVVKPSGNPWSVSFMRMLDMSNDSHLFQSAPGAGLLPLYEAKMIWHFTHRHGDYADYPEGAETTALPPVPLERLQNPAYALTHRYYVPSNVVQERLAGRWARDWLLGFRDITNATNERTAIFSLLPCVGVNHKAPLLFLESDQPALKTCLLLTCVNSITFDFIARQKIGGTQYRRSNPVS